MKRDLVIMARSLKLNSYCVAGIDVKTGEWIRPVSTNRYNEGAVSYHDLIYNDGTELKTLDVVRIDFTDKPNSNVIQPENRYYNEKRLWQKIDRYSINQVIDKFGYNDREFIFYDEDRSVHVNDLPNSKRESLLLLEVKVLTLSIETKSLQDFKRKYYVDLEYNGILYHKISITDLRVCRYFENHADGEYPIDRRSIVTCSLTNPYPRNNRCYKMVAQVFKISR